MPGPLEFALINTSSSNEPIYAFVTGINIADGRQCLLSANGKDLYFPTNPPAVGSPLQEDCAIPLGQPGSTKAITVPKLAGGRLWFSRGAKLVFLLNPGPALVEPSVLNPSDPNATIDFGFCEFTLNDAQIYANISFVDFVPRLPIGISLDTTSGVQQNVSGLPINGLDRIATALAQQTSVDKWPWERLVVRDKAGQPLRILNATHGDAVGASFDAYYNSYVSRVWNEFATQKMSLNTQAAAGVVSGSVKNNQLVLGNESFSAPTSSDIFGCNTGPFNTANASPERLAIIPRLAAGFVRSCLLTTATQPSAESTYYKDPVTNHYARIVHATTTDGKGYAFAYDDVQPDGAPDLSGKVNAGDPLRFVVSVGGGTAENIATAEKHVTGTPAPAHAQGGQAGKAGQTAATNNSGHGIKQKLNNLAQKVLH